MKTQFKKHQEHRLTGNKRIWHCAVTALSDTWGYRISRPGVNNIIYFNCNITMQSFNIFFKKLLATAYQPNLNRYQNYLSFQHFLKYAYKYTGYISTYKSIILLYTLYQYIYIHTHYRHAI